MIMARDQRLVELGEKIAEARRAAGYRTQADLADALGVHRSMMGFLEQGRHPVPLLKAARLSRLIGIPIREILPTEDVSEAQLRVLDCLEQVPEERQEELVQMIERLAAMLKPSGL